MVPLELKSRLLVRFVFCGAGIKASTAAAVEFTVGMTLLVANGKRQGTPPTIVVVDGSKIWFVNTCCPVQGLITGCPLAVTGGPKSAEKSPVRSAVVGTVLITVAPWFCL